MYLKCLFSMWENVYVWKSWYLHVRQNTIQRTLVQAEVIIGKQTIPWVQWQKCEQEKLSETMTIKEKLVSLFGSNVLLPETIFHEIKNDRFSWKIDIALTYLT